ncbi:hypothetical protein HanPI659440_Chr01g0030571 [Helianthus annuus]|nr:hypothetical protein HanPI659440_Chr01g0030571 [Helianthus annuus]
MNKDRKTQRLRACIYRDTTPLTTVTPPSPLVALLPPSLLIVIVIVGQTQRTHEQQKRSRQRKRRVLLLSRRVHVHYSRSCVLLYRRCLYMFVRQRSEGFIQAGPCG